MLRNPFPVETLEHTLHFAICCCIFMVHPCASTYKRSLVRLYLNLCVRSSKNARYMELLLDVLHVSVHLLQSLVVLLEVRLSTPSVRPVQ